MNDRIKNYQNFFLDQIEEAEREHLRIVSAPISQLVKKGEKRREKYLLGTFTLSTQKDMLS